MVLTNAQTTAFFKNAAQMGITDKTVVQLGNERITTVENLMGFEEETIQQVADILRCPGDKIPYPTPNVSPRATI